MPKLDQSLLEDYASSFYGYGHYGADFWFIGIGEGGGDALDEVRSHLDAWRQLGRNEVDDLQDSDAAYNAVKQRILNLPSRPVSPYLGPTAKVQKTWGGLIRILLRYVIAHTDDPAGPISDNVVLDHQRTLWARNIGLSCILEVSPLPSPSVGLADWHYPEWTVTPTLPQFVSPIACLDHYGPSRAQNIRSVLLAQNPRPKFVVMYALTQHYVPFWEKIAGGKLSPHCTIRDLFIKQGDGTVFAATIHPAYQFYKYRRGEDIIKYLDRVGTELARLNPYSS